MSANKSDLQPATVRNLSPGMGVLMLAMAVML
jgi:hypothetical protein